MVKNNVRSTADFVIVGAGTAGCVLAARLSESGKYRVALLEAGSNDTNPWIDLPFGMQMLITNPKVNWLYESEPISGIGDRRVFQPRGKVVGGSGAIMHRSMSGVTKQTTTAGGTLAARGGATRTFFRISGWLSTKSAAVIVFMGSMARCGCRTDRVTPSAEPLSPQRRS